MSNFDSMWKKNRKGQMAAESCTGRSDGCPSFFKVISDLLYSFVLADVKVKFRER